MATTCSLCSVFNDDTVIDIGDPCVCNAEIGAVLVTSDFQIYVRVQQSDPCDISDWQLLGSSGGVAFNIVDEFGGNQTVNDTETITFVGIDGATITVSPTNTVTINGRMFYSTGAPVAPPPDISNVALHLNCTASTLYAWCPASSSWLGPIGGVGGGGTFNSFTITDGVNSQTINDGNAILFTSPNGSVTITVSATDTLAITVNAAQVPITDAGSYYIGGTIELALQEIGAKLHDPVTLTNNAAPFAWNTGTQVGNIPQVPSLTLPAANQLSFNQGNGSTQNIALTYVNSIVDNGDGTVTFNFSNGSSFILNICSIIELSCGIFFLDANFIGIPTNTADGNPVTFISTSQSSRPPGGWQWSYSLDGVSWTLFSTLESPSFTFPAPGVYWIRLIFTNDQSASDTEIKPSYITITGGGGGGDTATFAFSVPAIVNNYDDCDTLPTYPGGFDSVTVPPPGGGGGGGETFGPNLIVNGGFETLGAGGADIWATWEEQNTVIEDETAAPFAGSHAAKLTRTGGSTPHVRQFILVEEGETYRIIGKCKTDGVVAARYRVFDNTNSVFIVNTTNITPISASWTEFTADVIIPIGCAQVRVDFLGTGTDGVAAYYDDLEFRKIL